MPILIDKKTRVITQEMPGKSGCKKPMAGFIAGRVISI
ncbi:hypothetical protein J2X73_002703 [Novosphingobium sp. 1748]|nr:hypothetical protein [Novosphingobium sp. 1748]